MHVYHLSSTSRFRRAVACVSIPQWSVPNMGETYVVGGVDLLLEEVGHEGDLLQ